MTYTFPLLFLVVICSPGKILGTELETIPEPVNTVISKSYPSVCRLKGDKVANELYALTAYSVKVAGRINTKLADHKSKQEDLITRMCRNDKKLRSDVKALLTEICDKKAPQSTIEQEIIDETCNSLVPKQLKSWRDGTRTQIPNATPPEDSPGKNVGTELETIPEPVDTVISKSYKSVCRLKGDKVAKELYALTAYSVKVAGRINTELADQKSKQEDLITRLCRNDKKLRSDVKALLTEICDKKAPQSTIEQEIIDETCNSLVPKQLKSWRDGAKTQIPNATTK